MKSINLFLALYITLVAGIPCSDMDTCVDEERSGKEVSISTHDHSEGEVDYCSPFCICNCCNMQMSQPDYFYFQPGIPGFTDQNSIWKTQSLRFIPQTIWQPPRLT